MTDPWSREALGFRTPGFRTLNNFYEGVQFTSPALGYALHPYLMTIAICALRGNRESAYASIERARDLAQGLSYAQSKLLDSALEDLGYQIVYK